MKAAQLTLDGGAVPHPPPGPYRFTVAQREIVLVARALGAIRSSQAGRVMHTHRRESGRGYCGTRLPEGSLGCCEYAASDGLPACRRLEARGVLRHAGRGRWEATSS